MRAVSVCVVTAGISEGAGLRSSQRCTAIATVVTHRGMTDGLLQNMSNSVLGPVDLYVTQARQAVWRAAKACPFLPVTWRSSLVDDAVHLTRRLFTTVAAQVPEALQRDHLLSVKRTINRQFVVLPLDKNPGRPIVLCRRLYYNLLLQSYGDETQFECVADFQTVQQASKFTLGILRDRAEGMQKHFKSGKRFKPPSTFLMVKNKSREEQGEGLKVRLVFSYFAHPLKAYAKRVGRCLTLLSKKAQALLPTFEMQNISDIVSWFHRTHVALSQAPPVPGGAENHETCGCGSWTLKKCSHGCTGEILTSNLWWVRYSSQRRP